MRHFLHHADRVSRTAPRMTGQCLALGSILLFSHSAAGGIGSPETEVTRSVIPCAAAPGSPPCPSPCYCKWDAFTMTCQTPNYKCTCKA
jgi:hypothetical protein